MYQFLVYLHVVSAFAFFMAHGASAAMAFQIKRETELERIKAIMDLSNLALPVAYFSLLALLLAGTGAGIMGNWFSRGWIWAAIVLLILMWFGMVAFGSRYFSPIRKALGLPYRDRGEEHAAGSSAPKAEILALIQDSKPFVMAGMYLIFILLMLWLMIYKPF